MSENSNKKRGPYKKTKSKSVERPANYFKEEHEHTGFFVSWADAIDRGNGHISVAYKFFGDKKQYRAPRWKTAFMDDLGIDAAKMIVSEWKKSNNNSTGKGSLLPKFYMTHRRKFLKWLGNTAKATTIAGYEAALETYIFPYFVDRLGLDNPKKWNQDAVSKWDSFLSEYIGKASSRNRKRTALSRYLRFLFRENLIKSMPITLFEQTKRMTKETPIPGELPSWENILTWLKSLPSGRYRFVRAVTMGFGLRISEALAVTEEDFIGDDFKDDILAKNNFVSRLVEKDLSSLFLEVSKAKKRAISSDILKIVGEGGIEDPKSGTYTACCTNEALAEFIVELIINGEHKEELTSEQVYKFKKSTPVDKSPYKFHLFNPHDDRRLNITLQCLDLSMDINDVVEVCCQLHGQSSREVFARYFQWGQMQRRIQARAKNKGQLKVIKRAKSS